MSVHQFIAPWSDVEKYFLFEMKHYNCGGPIVSKSGYNEGIPLISRKYSNFDNLTFVDQGQNYRVFNKEKWDLNRL